VVIHDHIRRPKEARRAHGQQLRVARARTDEKHFPLALACLIAVRAQGLKGGHGSSSIDEFKLASNAPRMRTNVCLASPEKID
jgi:hypothetical protein